MTLNLSIDRIVSAFQSLTSRTSRPRGIEDQVRMNRAAAYRHAVPAKVVVFEV